MKKAIKWNENGWTALQDADGKKHVLGISARAEDGQVVEVLVRHHSGEDQKGVVLYNGVNALPMDLAAFKKAFENDELEIR